MARNKKNKKNKKTTYKRGKVEITGNDPASKALMFTELLTSRAFWIALLLIALFTDPKASWIPLLLRYLKAIGKYLLTLFMVLVPLLMLLSG